MKSIEYRSDKDTLCGISVLLVVFIMLFPKILPGEFIGVVFFVISGYLITTINLFYFREEILA